MNNFSKLIPSGLARYLTLSLEKIGMIFFASLPLYLIEKWNALLNLTKLAFIRHIVCALIAKISNSKYEFRKEYFTGFT